MEEEHGRALASRGLGFQAVGFAIVGCAGTIMYHTFTGSDHWGYQLFEVAVSKFYWAFAVTLAAIFDWVRKMFETVQEIRRAARQRIVAKARAKGLEEGIAEGRAKGLEEGIAEGRAKGLEEGIAEGRARGIAEVMRRAQSRMEREGFPPDTIDRILNGHRNGSDR